MRAVFEEHFYTKKETLTPAIVSRFSAELHSHTQSLLLGVEEWKFKVMSSTLGQQFETLWKPVSNEDRTELSHLLFKLFKKYLCQQKQPNLDLRDDYMADTVQSSFAVFEKHKAIENFEELFVDVPNSFAICHPFNFCLNEEGLDKESD